MFGLSRITRAHSSHSVAAPAALPVRGFFHDLRIPCSTAAHQGMKFPVANSNRKALSCRAKCATNRVSDKHTRKVLEPQQKWVNRDVFQFIEEILRRTNRKFATRTAGRDAKCLQG